MMTGWISFVILLSGTSVLTAAEQKTFCKENTYQCRTERRFGCSGTQVIRINVLYVIHDTVCGLRVHPGANLTSWNTCCCQEHIIDRRYTNDAYKDKLKTECDNKTSCMVYKSFPLNQIDGKITVQFQCYDPTTGTDMNTNHQSTSTDGDKVDGVFVPVIMSCVLILTIISVIIAAVICYRLRHRRLVIGQEKEGFVEETRHGDELTPVDSELYSEPYDKTRSVTYDSCSDTTENPLNVTEDCYEYAVVDINVCSTRESSEDYNKVSRAGKRDVFQRDVTYDHVVHTNTGMFKVSYDNVGDSTTRDNEVDNTYNTCLTRILSNNTQQHGDDKT